MHIDDLKDKILPILRKRHILRAGVFGSYAHGAQTKDSDIDILVELGEEISLLDFISIKYELEDVLGRKVDLVEYQSIKPTLRKRILADEIRIHGEEKE